MRFRRSLTVLIIPAIFTLVLLLVLVISPHHRIQSDLVIYDVHPENPRVIKADGSVECFDYLRIKNTSDRTYDLTGMYLSDSRNGKRRLGLDGVNVDAGSSVMIKLDPLWDFALKSTGNENVFLFDATGNVIYTYTEPQRPSAPRFSAESGFYDDAFLLTLTSPKGLTIRYTLDGSTPDENSPKYSEPIHVFDRFKEPDRVVGVENTVLDWMNIGISDPEGRGKLPDGPVDKAFVVRAVAIDENGLSSSIATKEFFFCEDKYRNILSVVADPKDLFGDYGIMSTGREYDEWYLAGAEGKGPDPNFLRRGRAWEVPADMDYFRSGEKVLTQKCGLRVQGRWTREKYLKNFQIRARKGYSGSNVFEYDFFDNEPYRSDGLILKDSFNEAY